MDFCQLRLTLNGAILSLPVTCPQCDLHHRSSTGSTIKDRPSSAGGIRKWLDSHREASRLQAQLPTTRVVSVADRENDLYELLVAAQHPEAADGLVRARHDRRINTSGQPLSRHLQAQPPDAEVEVDIPQRHNQPGRIARLAVRFARVTLQPLQSKRHLGPVTLNPIQATGIDPPDGVKGLSWTLMTTVPTVTAAAACQRLQWYATRWQIEVYHRTLKSGCRTQQRHLGDAERIETGLAIDIVIAWRTFWLTKWGRERPEAPSSTLLEPGVWRALLVRTDVTWGTQIPRMSPHSNGRCTSSPGATAIRIENASPVPRRSGASSSASRTWPRSSPSSRRFVCAPGSTDRKRTHLPQGRVKRGMIPSESKSLP
ncbi:MAG: IS4 family transposase [Spiribacter salinus]|uniref:IS4 family transposase n=1 Tax=Spiribacter salinus TaxID=1335746 RepID=A0A540VD03_9GAMM|nr:MAG: IS4 family transposase [Spiribacter salinus]